MPTLRAICIYDLHGNFSKLKRERRRERERKEKRVGVREVVSEGAGDNLLHSCGA